MNNKPIGIFDSGKGGLTVLEQVKKQLPQESVIYYGDVARVPFGNKTPEEIININFEIISYLVKRGVKMVISACNTSSAIAIKEDQNRFEVPIVGLIQPGAKAAVAVTKNNKIGVAATIGTVNSHAYQKQLLKEKATVEVFEVACPDFVTLVEAGKNEGPEVKAAIKKYLNIFKEKKS
ncbi:MAG: glutamate racemase [Candidatus Margulisbacteria bacterium]|nr:glutamate racemase [Candidatus Margulisiibacteriota bacterium]